MDARVSMHDMAALLEANEPEAAGFARTLLARARSGIGGEISVAWPDGPAWLAARVPVRYSLGGTGPHAAWALSVLGAPALLCLGDRSAHMLAHVPPRVLLAGDGALLPAHSVRAQGNRRPEIFIFEFTAGLPTGSIVPERSSRIIVRFHNPGLEQDHAFDETSRDLAPTAGAALIAGFNAVPAGALDSEIARAAALARSWREAALETLHLELAGYDSVDLLDKVLAGFRGVITSIGMSCSELNAIERIEIGPADAMMRLGERLDCERVCVHADHWAASVTRREPEREREALLTGCLLASGRAAAGLPVRPESLDPSARFHPLPFPAYSPHGEWVFVACAAPYLAQPATTLGLGDTFTAGCLLALGRAQARPARA